ncbi:MAG: methyltransferase domain-containing protein, partial [Myxococcales bacterium]|nr:methyltransferase domain-containing protein [Myxococcales bacterium]
MKSRRTHKQEALAKLYDAEILPIWAQRFGRMLLRDLTLPPKAMVLDVGCGTGYPALDVLRKMDDQGRIIAIDAAQSMLSIAREKAGALSGKRIYFRSEATEPRLSFADDVYDLVVSNLWLTEVDDPAALVSEFARVAKPGGRVIATTPLRGTFGEFYDIYREVLIKRDRTEALARLDHWTAHYPTPAHAEALFQRAGLTEVTVERETFTLLFKSSREFFFAPVIEYGPLSMWKEIAGKGPEMQEVFRQIKEAIDSYFGGGTFSVTVDAACIRGRKPETDEAARRAGEEVTRPGGAAQGEPPTDKKIRLPE